MTSSIKRRSERDHFPTVEFDALADLVDPRRVDGFYRSTYHIIREHVQALRFDGSARDRHDAGMALIAVSAWMGSPGAFKDLVALLKRYDVVAPVFHNLDGGAALDKKDLKVVSSFCNNKIVACQSSYTLGIRTDSRSGTET